MSTFDDIVKLISSININGSLELELKFILDKRIRTPHYINNNLNINTVDFYLYILDELSNSSIKKSQTINFIKSNDDHSMLIKQLYFNNSIQLKELKNHYYKKSLISPIFLESPNTPVIKLSCCNEKTVDEIDSNEVYNLVRFKERYSINININWRLDITLVHESNDINVISNLNKLKDIIKLIFCKIDNYKYSDKIEFEMEYIGDIKLISIHMIKEANEIINQYIDKFLCISKVENIIPNRQLIDIYTTNICIVAKLLKPNLVHKFQSGYYGLKQLGSNPIEIEKSMYYTDILPDINNYIITEKIDGTRSMVFIYIDRCYVINNKNINSITEIYLNDLDLETNKNIFAEFKDTCIILDAELIVQSELSGLNLNNSNSDCSELYYVFDIIKYCNIDTYKYSFDDRLVYINKIIDKYTFLKNKTFTYVQDLIIANISLKDFYLKNYELIKMNQNYETDGLIIFNRNSNYNETKYYKWKPVSTIDFYLKKCPDTILGIEPYINKKNKILYILFSGVNDKDFIDLNLKKNKCYYDILCNKKFNKKYFPIQFMPSDNPWAYLFWYDTDDLDDKIVELTYDKEWKFVKIRDDRKNDMERKTYYGNYFKYAEFIWFNLQNKLKLNDMVYTTIPENNINQKYFKICNNDNYAALRKFNNFVKSKLIELNSNTLSRDNVIDICSGRGQDLQKYIKCKFKNIFMFDNDIDSISEIITRKHKYSKQTSKDLSRENKRENKRETLRDPLFTFPNIYAKHLNLLDIPSNNITSIKDLIKIANVDKVKMVVCNFALHYLIYNKTKLNNFIKLLHSVLDIGGIFIFTTFDGKKIFDLLTNNDKYERIINGKKIYSIKKKYTSDEFNGLGHKIEVLLPFSNDEYYTEYLLNIDLVKSAFHKKGINLMIESSFMNYMESFNLEKKYFYDKLKDIDKEYIDLHKFYIFHNDGKKK
jgi:hypothetical protein